MDFDREHPLGSCLRMWRADAAECLCMCGATTSYAVDPLGEYVVGVVVAGAMLARRGRDRFVFEPGDVCAWDPSAAHSGLPYGCTGWQARLLVIETLSMQKMVQGVEGPALDIRFAKPHRRDPLLARRFVELHRALETTSWRLECETLLFEWLCAAAGHPPERCQSRRAARRDPALRRARELLCDELAANVTLDELAGAVGVSRHRLTRLFRAAYDMPPHRFQLAYRIGAARRMLERGVPVAEVAVETGFVDQSHLHRHFRKTLGMTPARYADLAAQTYKTSMS